MLGVSRVTVVEIEVGGHRKDFALMEKVKKWVEGYELPMQGKK